MYMVSCGIYEDAVPTKSSKLGVINGYQLTIAIK